MATVTEIKQAVQALSEDQLREFAAWFDAFEQARWDRQIEHDQQTGPLRQLMDKAQRDFEAGKCRPL